MVKSSNFRSDYIKIILKFVVVFALLCLAVGIVAATGLDTRWTELLARQIGHSLSSCGFKSSVSGNLIHTSRRNLAVILECTALFVMVTYAAMILAYPFSRFMKFTALIIGLPLIYTANYLRLMAVGVASIYLSSPTFEVVHDYLFQLAMVLITVLIWGIFVAIDARDNREEWFKIITRGSFIKRFAKIVFYASVIELVLYGVSKFSPLIPPISYTSVLAPVVGYIFSEPRFAHKVKMIWASVVSLVVLMIEYILFTLSWPASIWTSGYPVWMSVFLSAMYLVFWVGIPVAMLIGFVVWAKSYNVVVKRKKSNGNRIKKRARRK